MRLSDIVSAIHQWAPPETAQSYDNVGIQVGDPAAEIANGLVALDLTPGVIDEAVESDVDLIITHHPLLFKGLKSVRADDLIGGMVRRLIRHEIALVAAHTNLDAAPDGVSARLAETLGVENVEVLEPLPRTLLKLVTHVPGEHADAVRESITGASGQTIGPYADVAFASRGRGFFRPLDNADPFIGTPGGEIESVKEKRIEVTLAPARLAAAIRALEDSHPYQTPTYDVYQIDSPVSELGLGMIGNLPESESLSAFVQRVSSRLNAAGLRYVGRDDASVKRVAVCGGAGRDLVRTALRAGADAYVTADLTYHTFFEVLDHSGQPDMALIDAGHYETEAEAEALLVEWLNANAPAVSWNRTAVRTSPIRYVT